MKKIAILKTVLVVLCDLALAGILLCIFALFHHVIPQKGDTSNAISIPKPSSGLSDFVLPEYSVQTSTPSPTVTPTITVAPASDSYTSVTYTPTTAPTPTPTPTLTPTPTPTPIPEPTLPIQSENTYQSENTLVNMKTIQSVSGDTIVTYHLADIYITNIEQLRSGFAHDTYGEYYTQSVLEQDKANTAIVAISGDSYGLSGAGIVLRNGILYKYSNTKSDICVLYYDGRMETLSYGEYTKDSLIENGAYQVWSFGPELLDDSGKAKTSFNTGDYIAKTHPRAAIGYYEPGHYVLVLVDGRQEDYSIGLDIEGLANLFEDLGCKAAYNLDGGISAVMTFNNKVYSHPARTREVSDIIYIAEVQ